MRPWDPAGHGPLTITQENDEVFHRDFQIRLTGAPGEHI